MHVRTHKHTHAKSYTRIHTLPGHLPIKMPDKTTRIYYMGGNGPHSGQRNSSFGLATIAADRFAGIASGGAGRSMADASAATMATASSSKTVVITGGQMIVTADLKNGGSVSFGIAGAGVPLDFPKSIAVTDSGTDAKVTFPGVDLSSLVGKEVTVTLYLNDGMVFTIGFM